MLIKPEVEKFARIKVIGVGGGGSNSIKTMMEEQSIQGVEFIAVNTDSQHLASSPAPIKVQIGKELTKGLGSGGNPEVGRKSAEESHEVIEAFLDGTDMVFITAGMGGGTGSGAAPYIAELARKKGALTVGVVTKPFSFEGARRMSNAEKSLEEMRAKVDALITIPNQRLLEIMDENRPLIDAFKVADSVLGQSVQGISDIIVLPGLINRDFADVKSVMSEAGSALMGIGYGSGEDRAIKAAQEAINSPLLENSIDGAKGILFNVVGGFDLTLSEVNKAAEVISAAADPDANIIFGAAIDESQKDTIKITVIATGFDSPRSKDNANIHARLRQQHAAEPQMGGTIIKTQITTPMSDASDDEYDTPAFLRRR